MKLNLSVLSTFVLCAAIAVTVVLTIKTRREAQIVWRGVVNQTVQANYNKAVAPSYADMVGFKSLIESVARSFELPLTTTINGQALTVSVNTSMMPKDVILRDHSKEMMLFLNVLSALPYQMVYQRLSLGEGSTTGLDLAIQVNGI